MNEAHYISQILSSPGSTWQPLLFSPVFMLPSVFTGSDNDLAVHCLYSAPSEWPKSLTDPPLLYMIRFLLPFPDLLFNHNALHIQPQP